jgi:hypothetical protein
MGTWISHLRIAENLLAAVPGLDEVAFTLGSLAPDSGIPVPGDAYLFDPPKEVTHFLHAGDSESRIRDLDFYREYVAPLTLADDVARYSFRLAYFFHLLADAVWSARIAQAQTAYYATLFEKHGGEAWTEVKRDWYDLDRRYLRDHPRSLYWRVLLPAPNPQPDLPFLVETALHQQLTHIRAFYRQTPTSRLDRRYPYLNAATLERYVSEVTAHALNIYDLLVPHGVPERGTSSLALLSHAVTAPYAHPLGDAP